MDAPALADALFRRVSNYGLGVVAGGADDEDDEDEVDKALRRALALSDESIALAAAANPFGASVPAVALARHSSKPEASKQNPFGGGPPAPPPPAPPPRAEVSKQASNPFGGGAPASASPPPRTHGSGGGKNPFAKAPAATTAPARKETAEEIAARMMAEIDDI